MISVVMSVYNDEKFLQEAIESILNQTFLDFEFIIINDGSNDKSLSIIESYQNKDDRIVVLQNETNLGLALSLNKGIEIANGKYIARMDADDISLPERFEKQIEYLEKTPEIWILGSNIIQIDNDGNIIREVAYPTEAYDLRWCMIFGLSGVVCHPCAMIRKEVFSHYGRYENVPTSQDLELWSRFFLLNPLPIKNLQIPLLKYRWHGGSISIKNENFQHHISNQIRLKTINHNFLKSYELEIVEVYRSLTPEKFQCSKQKTKQLITAWFEILKDFQKKFTLKDEDMKLYYEQLFFRIKNLISLNPLVILSNKQIIWLCKLIPVLGLRMCACICVYKIRYRMGKIMNAQN